jgi:hypothetical protein
MTDESGTNCSVMFHFRTIQLRMTVAENTGEPRTNCSVVFDFQTIQLRMTVAENTGEPRTNCSVVFHFQTIQLRMTVAENTREPRAYSIGHVIVGSQASGKALSHWNQMLSSLRKPIAMWHALRK